MRPDRLPHIPWRGRQLRVRHDDPKLGLYADVGKQLCAAVQLATDLEGLRLALATTVERQYTVRVADDGRNRALEALALFSHDVGDIREPYTG